MTRSPWLLFVILGAVLLAGAVFVPREKPQETDLEIAAPADTGRGPWAHPDAPTLRIWSEAAGIPYVFTYAVAWRETRNNPSPDVRGARGEIGRFQVMPATAKSRCGGLDVRTPEGNLACFLRMARADLAGRCAGDFRCAARVHNGPGWASERYADNVMADVKTLVERGMGR